MKIFLSANYRGRQQPQLLLMLILLAYIGLTLAYGMVTPLFEAPDEHHHFYTVRYIALEQKLPIVSTETTPLRQEAAQPPLYYILGALLTAPVFETADRLPLRGNPFAKLGDFYTPFNNNLFIHTTAEAWPWRGEVLAAHLLRIFSTALGTGTLVCIYLTGRVVWPKRAAPALLSTALIAFLPQFNSLHAAITNDTLIIFLASAAMWQTMRLWTRPAADTAQRTNRLTMLFLGITVGLAMLTKATGILLLIWVSGVIILYHWQAKRQHFHWMKDLAAVIIPALLISGWLFLRNWQLYGDPTAATQFALLGGRQHPYSLRALIHDLNRVWLSSIAVFGWMSVAVPHWIYWLWGGLGGIGVAVWVGHTVYNQRYTEYPKHSFRMITILLGWWLLVAAAWLRFMWQTPADQGRLLFPALLPVALVVGYGLWQWPLRKLHWLWSMAALSTTLYCVIVVLPDAYWPPATLASVEDIPSSATRLNFPITPHLTLLAANVETPEVAPGDWVWITLFWQANDHVEGLEDEVLQIFGRDMTPAGKLHTLPVRGLWPTDLWPAETIIVDLLGAQIDSKIQTPVEARLWHSWSDLAGGHEVGRIKVVGPPAPPITPPLAHFANGIQLAEVTVSEPDTSQMVMVDVVWQIEETTQLPNLTTFVHLGAQTAAPLAQSDGLPMGGFYPTTRWEIGEHISDHYIIQLTGDMPAGRYPIHIGLYDPIDGVRVPVYVAGVEQPFATYEAGIVTIR